jgi:hypothetical protein
MLDECVMLQTKEGPKLAINASVSMLPVRELCSAHLNLLNPYPANVKNRVSS